jgi:nucleoid DNA-binding protein
MNYLKCQNSRKFISSLAYVTGLTPAQSKEAYVGLRKLIVNELVENGKFVIPGVGKFIMRNMKERKMKIVKDTQLIIPPHKFAAFKFFQMFRKHLKEDLIEFERKNKKTKEVA